MIDVICQYEGGDTVTTGFNGTLEEARQYFEGKHFNFGIEGDFMVKCIRVCLCRDVRLIDKVGCEAYGAIESSGYRRELLNEEITHDLICKAGIMSSPANSNNYFHKDGKQWLYFGWYDDFKYIKVMDVSDIYEDYLRIKLSV